MHEIDPIIDSIDKAPEALRPFYSQDSASGKFRLVVREVDGFALENVAGLRSTLQDQKAKHDRAQAALKAFEGLDPAKAREALETIASGKVKGDDAVNALKREYEAKLAERDGKLNEFAQAERRRALASAIDAPLAGRAEIPAELRGIVRDIFSSYIGVNDAGQVGVWNADKTGFRLTSKGGDYGAAMSPAELIESALAAAANGKRHELISAEHAAMLPRLMAAQGKGGSGGSGSAAPSNHTRESFRKMTATEQARALKTNPELKAFL